MGKAACQMHSRTISIVIRVYDGRNGHAKRNIVNIGFETKYLTVLIIRNIARSMPLFSGVRWRARALLHLILWMSIIKAQPQSQSTLYIQYRNIETSNITSPPTKICCKIWNSHKYATFEIDFFAETLTIVVSSFLYLYLFMCMCDCGCIVWLCVVIARCYSLLIFNMNITFSICKGKIFNRLEFTTFFFSF